MGIGEVKLDTAAEAVAGLDLAHKTAVVTGATSGLGLASARALLGAGATVLLSGRDRERLGAVAAPLVEQYGASRVKVAVFDLADLKSVAAGAADIADQCSTIDILINNAGIMAVPEQRSVDGFEMQFAANFLGHYLLTRLLLPNLLAAGQARGVNLSSGGHKLSPVLFDDFNFEQRPYDKWVAYGQAKTAMSLFSVALSKRFAEQGLLSNAVHPGMVMTNLGRHMTSEDVKDMLKDSAMANQPMVYLKPEQGAATQIWAATSPELAGVGGRYLEQGRIAKVISENDGREDGVMAYALDEQSADALWDLAEGLVSKYL